MRKKTFLYLTVITSTFFFTGIIGLQAQIKVQLIVESGSSHTQCSDPFDAPDPGWLIMVENLSLVRYAGKVQFGCPTFPSLPHVQYEMNYDFLDDVPEHWQVCFQADEHDPWLYCPGAQCVETVCEDLLIPPPGSSATYTLEIPQGNFSWGQATVTIVTSGSPIDSTSTDWNICNFPELYGQEGYDINFGNKILKTSKGHFVVIGQWNQSAYAMEVDQEGRVVLFRTFEAEIGGSSNMEDVEHAEGGGYVFTGTCENCSSSDTTSKVFVFKTDSDFEVDTTIGVKKFGYADGGPFPSTAERTNPELCKGLDGGYLLASTSIIGQLNYGDIVLTKLDQSLDSVWSSFYNFGSIEAVSDLIPLNQGYGLATVVFFVDEAPVFMVDPNGQMLWSQMVPSNILKGITYSPNNDGLFVAGVQTDAAGGHKGTLYRLSASDGQLTDTLAFGQGMQESGIFDLELLSEDHLLLALQQGHAGASSTISSWAYLIGIDSQFHVMDSVQVLSDFSQENVRIQSLVALDCADLRFASTGVFRLNTERQTFVHVRANCEDIIQTDAYAFCENENVTLSVPDTIFAEAYSWSTGDTTSSITVDTAGDYSVVLYTECGQVYDTIHLTSFSGPTAAFGVSLNLNVLTVTNNSTDASSYLWDFGDGTTSNQENPSPHEYLENGNYTVTLIAYNECGSDVATVEITVAQAPKADFSAAETVGCVPFVVQFSDESDFSPTSWYWEFGGGEPQTSSEQNPVVSYLAPGVYGVTLSVTNDFGSDILQKDAYITVMDIPNAGFTYEQNDLAVSFQSIEPMAIHFWNFGDGQFSDLANPIHNYVDAGTYVVLHAVENECGENVQVDTVMLATTAIEETLAMAGWHIFPNPFYDQIVIEAKGIRGNSDVWTVELLDARGQKVAVRQLNPLWTVFDTRELPAGIYLLQFFKNGTLISSGKLVKIW